MGRLVILGLLAGCGFSHGTILGDATSDVPGDIADGLVDAARCPTDYSVVAASSPQSRYRVNTMTAPFAVQHADCLDDLTGATHLVVFDSASEAYDVGAAWGLAAGTDSNSVFYVGLVQQPDQTQTTSNWFWLTGSAFTLQWVSGNPNDGDGFENNRENVGRARPNGFLEDALATMPYGAVCECDESTIDPTIATYIQ